MPFEDIFQSDVAIVLQSSDATFYVCVWHIFSRLVNVVIIVIVCIHVPLTTLFQIDTVKTILYDFSGRNL